jgi:hypothetical protein
MLVVGIEQQPQVGIMDARDTVMTSDKGYMLPRTAANYHCAKSLALCLLETTGDILPYLMVNP